MYTFKQSIRPLILLGLASMLLAAVGAGVVIGWLVWGI